MTASERGYDDIIVGGGTAGIVLAARLSEDPARRVLLLEAGPDYPEPDAMPTPLLDGRLPVLKSHNWPLVAALRDDASIASGASGSALARASRVLGRLGQVAPSEGHRIDYPMARVMGGGSAVNAGLTYIPGERDFAAWSQAGNDWWRWSEVQAFMESVADLPILRTETLPLEACHPHQQAFAAACDSLGFGFGNLARSEGEMVGVVPKNQREGRRVSTASAYLQSARSRANLTIVADCVVDRVLFRGGVEGLVAEGVEAVAAGAPRAYHADRVFLCAGAVHSPTILLRSGIGPAADLGRVGVNVRCDLPGVGHGLVDHPSVGLWAVPSGDPSADQEPAHQILLQMKSSEAAPEADLHLIMLSQLPTAMFPQLREAIAVERVMGIAVVVRRPRSRGWLRLVARRPDAAPEIRLNCLEDADDLRVAREGARAAWRIMQHPELRKHVRDGVRRGPKPYVALDCARRMASGGNPQDGALDGSGGGGRSAWIGEGLRESGCSGRIHHAGDPRRNDQLLVHPARRTVGIALAWCMSGW
jgi:choline dehydrogenase